MPPMPKEVTFQLQACLPPEWAELERLSQLITAFAESLTVTMRCKACTQRVGFPVPGEGSHTVPCPACQTPTMLTVVATL